MATREERIVRRRGDPRDNLVCIPYAILMREMANYVKLRLFPACELHELLMVRSVEADKEVRRLIYDGAVRSDTVHSAVYTKDRMGAV